MSDLISRQVVIGLIRGMYPSQPILPSNRRKWEEKYEPFIRVEREISNLPSAQPEIVRCKDCKHNSLKRMRGNTYCDLGMELSQLYDFCSLGERRTDE